MRFAVKTVIEYIAGPCLGYWSYPLFLIWIRFFILFVINISSVGSNESLAAMQKLFDFGL